MRRSIPEKQQIDQDVHEASEKTTSTNNIQNDETGAENNAVTPMERLLQFGEQGVMADVTASVQRAKAMAQYFDQWASKTPKGLVIKDTSRPYCRPPLASDSPRSRCIEQLALEKFTKGGIRIEKHCRHG